MKFWCVVGGGNSLVEKGVLDVHEDYDQMKCGNVMRILGWKVEMETEILEWTSLGWRE